MCFYKKKLKFFLCIYHPKLVRTKTDHLLYVVSSTWHVQCKYLFCRLFTLSLKRNAPWKVAFHFGKSVDRWMLKCLFKFLWSNVTRPGLLDLDPGSQGNPRNLWCVSFETGCKPWISSQPLICFTFSTLDLEQKNWIPKNGENRIRIECIVVEKSWWKSIYRMNKYLYCNFSTICMYLWCHLLV